MRTEKAYPIKPNPMRSSRNKIQLGVFSTNTEGGCTVTNAPERLRGDRSEENTSELQSRI